MSYSPDQLIKIAVNFEKLASESLAATAKKKEKKSDSKSKGNKKLPPWLKDKSKKEDPKDKKDKKSDKKTKKSSLEEINSLLAKYAV